MLKIIDKANQKYLTLFFVITLIVGAVFSIKNTAIYSYGDGVEYILMTESFNNHLSPELKEKDINKYISFINKYKSDFLNEDVFLDIKQLFSHKNKLLENRSGFYVSKNGKIYSYHFWLYSFVNLPIRWCLGALHLDITYTFIITNYLLLFFAIFIVFRSKNLNYFDKIWVTLFLILSPIYWYLHWSHPEVFSSTLVFSSLVLFFDKKNYWAILLMSMASTHFPPLFIPTAFMLIYTLIQRGLTIKNLFLGAVSSSFVIIPSLFYLYNFSVPNLIIKGGFISTNYVTLNRLHNFFFDVNQGMILGLPLVLIVCIILLIYRIVKLKFSIIDGLLLSVLLMSYFYMQMANWNHGMSVVNRYVIWNAMFVLFYFIWFAKDFRIRQKMVLFFMALLTQASCIYYFSNNKIIQWDYGKHNEIAVWLLNNHPEWYNPEPHIFISRTNRFNLSHTDSVIVYSRPDSTIMKLMVYKGSPINQLIQRGIKKDVLADFMKDKTYYNGCLYINKKDLNLMGYIQHKDTLISSIEKQNDDLIREEIRQHIMRSKSYQNLIKKKAIERSISFEQAMNDDINYLLYVERSKLYKNDKN